MVDFNKLLEKSRSKKWIARCSCCGKEIEYPNLYCSRLRDQVLSPYCCTTTVFLNQWLINHGWHIRNISLAETHPFFCPDCWTEGTPEYKELPYGKQWCDQAEKWMNEK